MWMPNASLPHLITQICFQLSRFFHLLFENTVWCLGSQVFLSFFLSFFFFMPLAVGKTEGYFMFWGNFYNLKLLASVAAPGLCVIKPYPQIMHQRDAFISSPISIWNHRTSYHSQTHFLLPPSLGKLRVFLRVTKQQQAIPEINIMPMPEFWGYVLVHW